MLHVLLGVRVLFPEFPVQKKPKGSRVLTTNHRRRHDDVGRAPDRQGRTPISSQLCGRARQAAGLTVSQKGFCLLVFDDRRSRN